MILIRAEQVAVFQRGRDKRYARQLLPRLRCCFPSACQDRSDEDLVECVLVPLTTSRAAGVSAGADLSTAILEHFVHLERRSRGRDAP